MTVTLKALADQVMVVTGASSGIGLVTARTAAAKGAKLVLVARSGEALETVAQEIGAAGGEAIAVEADVGDAAAMRRVADAAVERFGRIDTWVQNAGVAIYARLMDTPDDEHEQMFRTNYFGVVHAAKAAVPKLAGGGALIVVGSVASDLPSPVMGAYAASKHATKAYVESLRIELRAAGTPISITLVKPAGIDTPIGQHAANHEGGEAQIPPPVYDPQLVADAILDVAVHPRREITVGGAGRAQVLFAEHFPALFERLAPLMTKGLTSPDKPQPRPSNLFEGVRAGRERSGEQSPRTTSLYTSAALHPKTVLTAVGVVGAALALLALRGSSRREDAKG